MNDDVIEETTTHQRVDVWRDAVTGQLYEAHTPQASYDNHVGHRVDVTKVTILLGEHAGGRVASNTFDGPITTTITDTQRGALVPSRESEGTDG